MGRPQMKIRRMRIACWIPKVTNTKLDRVTFIACNNGCMNAPEVIFKVSFTYVQMAEHCTVNRNYVLFRLYLRQSKYELSVCKA
jgi:hypothetical protein